jgi:ribonuclease P protein component
MQTPWSGLRAYLSFLHVVKRAHRLRRPEQFQRVRREGQTLNHPLLRLNVAANRRKQTRCGFVVSKRIGGAVQRNRARRRTREAVRLLLAHIEPGFDLVFIIRTADVAEVPFARLQEAIRKLLSRAGVWQEHAVAAAPPGQQ